MSAATTPTGDLDQITPATQSVDASPSDVLAAAFPKHGRMADPDTGTWMIEDYWMPAEGFTASSPCEEPDCPEHVREAAAVAAVLADAAQHLHMEIIPAAHPEDLPSCLPTREQMLRDVMQRPAAEIVAALAVTGSAEPGVLLNAMAVTAP